MTFEQQYGSIPEPFGVLRTRLLEFLSAAVYFSQEILRTFEEYGIFNILLHFFVLYPFNNVLHLKVFDILTLLIDDYDDRLMEHLLEETPLLKIIMGTANENKSFIFADTLNKTNFGYLPFIRKLAN